MVMHGVLVLLFAPFSKFLYAFHILNVVLVVDCCIPETCIIQTLHLLSQQLSEQMEPSVTFPRVSVQAHQLNTLTEERFL
jgi:hypothetical protein